MLGMVAEFEANLIRMRTREGMAVAKAKGRLLGKPSKPQHRQGTHPTAEMLDAGGSICSPTRNCGLVARRTAT